MTPHPCKDYRIALHTDAPPRVGLIGAGGIARPHAQGWAALDALVHIFSLDGAPELAANVPGAQVCDTLGELFRHVDVVDICTPTDAHAHLVREALAAGKHATPSPPTSR